MADTVPTTRLTTTQMPAPRASLIAGYEEDFDRVRAVPTEVVTADWRVLPSLPMDAQTDELADTGVRLHVEGPCHRRTPGTWPAIDVSRSRCASTRKASDSRSPRRTFACVDKP